MKRWLLACLVLLLAGCATTPAQALGLKLSPLEYRTTLGKGEIKKGYIDIENPLAQRVVLKTSVQGFRQTDDDGDLVFFDDARLRAGIKLDLSSVALGPREALRMYFLIDGTKLPTGDVYAAIFFTTAQQTTAGVQPQVRVGTLLSIVNQTPGQRDAAVTDVVLPWLQYGSIAGHYAIKNTGDPAKSTGFYPEVTIERHPFDDTTTQTSSLVFAGHTRQDDFSVPAAWPGLYRVTVAYGDSKVTRYVVYLNDLSIAIGILLVAAATMGVGWRLHRKKLTQR